jgi:uncharacterized protein YeaO (DUF488 family)
VTVVNLGNEWIQICTERARVRTSRLTKEEADVNLWLKEIAPSSELRKRLDHDPKKWVGFKKRYKEEVGKSEEPFELLKEAAESGDVPLIYAAKDETHNEALALKGGFGNRL